MTLENNFSENKFSRKIKDEYIELLWTMGEGGDHSRTSFKNQMDDYNQDCIDELVSEGLIKLHLNGAEIDLTEEGREYAKKLIRAHRIGERLVYDVLGGDFEGAACELEHILHTGLVDSICTLLGHPRECPHGSPIPEGDCCRSAETVAYSSVISLLDMKIGESARVAYVCSRGDQQLHIIDSLQIKPGVIVTLHQKYPSFVIKCEGAHIALDESVAKNIRLWKDSCKPKPAAPPADTESRKSGRRWRWGKK